MSEDIYDEYPSVTLAKEPQDENIEPLKLGKRLKEIRMKLGLTLEDASKRTGLARSTLSKIENEQISPTFQAMQKLANGLRIDMPQLFEPPRKKWQRVGEILRVLERVNPTQLPPMSTSYLPLNFLIKK